jgi:SOS-response transcriptional repressor LexA
MDDTRRKRLAELIATHYKGDRAAFIRASGLSKGRVTQLLDPGGRFGERAAQELVRRLNDGDERLNLDERYFERDPGVNVEVSRPIRGAVPLISWVQAGQWEEAIDTFQPGDAEAWLPTMKAVSARAYALRVRGDSMTAPYGKSYPEGAYIVVEPERRSPVNGERIIAKLEGSNEVTFKVFKEDAGRRWLAPLNPQHPPIHDPFRVLGTVVGMWVDD